MRLLWFNLATDENDVLLGFAVRWIGEMARRAERIDVITMWEGSHRLPPHVHVYSAGREKGYSKPRRVVEFYRHLFHVLRNQRVDAAFSHMIPQFSVLAGPVLRARKIPLVTWYAHPALTQTLKLAHALSTRMVASVETAYPYKKDKLVVIGQGIDPEVFYPDSTLPEKPPIVLCVGRISPVKDQLTLIRAARILKNQGRKFRVWIVGNVVDKAYHRLLIREVQESGLEDVVEFKGPVPWQKLPQTYRKAWVHVNLTPTGFGDKVAWEAMACGRPSLGANEGYRETFGPYADLLLFRHGDEEDLARKLATLLSLSEHKLITLGNELSQRTLALHGLPSLMDRLYELLKGEA